MPDDVHSMPGTCGQAREACIGQGENLSFRVEALGFRVEGLG